MLGFLPLICLWRDTFPDESTPDTIQPSVKNKKTKNKKQELESEVSQMEIDSMVNKKTPFVNKAIVTYIVVQMNMSVFYVWHSYPS